MFRIDRALLSVTDKTGLVEFANGLHRLGVELLSTGGTSKTIHEASIPVREVSEITEFPEMLGGRLKTIHPRIAGGILAQRDRPDHLDSLAHHGIPTIDLVCINLYDFASVASRVDASVADLIEKIDIGGPTLIRAAAKNYLHVAVVTSPADYDAVLSEMRAGRNSLSELNRWTFAKKAFALTATYDRMISERLARTDEDMPARLIVDAARLLPLRYGENPHQKAALYGEGRHGIAGAEQLQGKELSYNNLVDLDAAWHLILEFSSPASAIIKHTNPCGCAEAESLAMSYRLAFESDPVSAFGGVLAFNREVDRDTAAEIAKTFIEAIAAPGYSPEALELLSAKKNLRLMRVRDRALEPLTIRSISGGYLAQTADDAPLDPSLTNVVTKRQPCDEEWAAMKFGWKVVKHVKSNAIVYARHGQLISAGAGQMSRVDSVRFGAEKARLPLPGSIVASDAFFPFPDGVEEAARRGVTAVIQPGGSVKDQEVIDAADRLGLAMVFTGVRHFRH